jgi:hypothetical protein
MRRIRRVLVSQGHVDKDDEGSAAFDTLCLLRISLEAPEDKALVTERESEDSALTQLLQ